MKPIASKWLITSSVLCLFIFSLRVRADIVDEETERTRTKPSASPDYPAAKVNNHEDEAKLLEPTRPLGGPTPHAKEVKSSNSTTVIPPKSSTKSSAARVKRSPQQSPVHFESLGLKGLREKGMVELSQQVVVTQDEMKLESDYAQVFFDEASHEVIRIVAQGKVRINGVDHSSGEKFRALSDKAVFLNSDKTVVLEGNAKLWRGEDSVIRSRKITYEMNTGWIRADRVAGEVQADSKSADGVKPTAKVTEKKK